MEMNLKRLWQCPLGFISTSQLAHAHGEDVLVSIYAELVSVALCVGVLYLWRRVRRYRRTGVLACIAGLILVNLAFLHTPYDENRELITAAGIIVPIVMTMLAVYVAQRRDRVKK
jgi:hypothetical protein